ncbi:hypothetical protein ASE75_10350 [Sphingomonas sp. Leaf17]|uniref:sensor domain-containing diguanylate cyclase n=1 Tax=Sphingomonas sp. Leaf17 TaxID=1735683 RepID=UPI0006F2D3CD|nr:sensor domain-containing diguanylate cyclase [Sphingomonas sp. Leaf17]KQM64365.1 hypothetical protein ASE75_10350 [Sphingomonas sp. Leaf17]
MASDPDRAHDASEASFTGLIWSVVLGLSYFATAMVSLYLTRGADGVATMWPPSGFLFAVLLLVRRRAMAGCMVAAGVASLAANLFAGNGVANAVGFTVANLAEAWTAMALLRRPGGPRVSFVNPAGVIAFGRSAAAGAIVSAVLATVVVAITTHGASVRFFLSWLTTVLLGMLLVAPMVLLSAEMWRARKRTLGTIRPVEAMLMLALVAGVAAATFLQSALPILFLPMMAIGAAVFRLGTIGAVAGILVVAVVGSVALAFGQGPPTLVAGGRDMQVLFLQFYLLTLFASALPTAALLAGRNRLQVELAEKLRLLSLAERAAQIGHWRVDTVRREIFWSPEVFRIHGLPLGNPPAFEEAVNAYHPDDQARVGRIVEQALADGLPFEFKARIVRPDGSVCFVVSRGERDYSSEDSAIGLFGLIQDVSAQMEVERVLTDARETAERVASAATIMAETDQLTGLANRRKILHLIDRAMEVARGDGSALSVAIFDIDHFKSINDTFGHAVGDQVLCRVARATEAALRATDAVGRFGGEEFVLLLPRATPEAAMAVAERVRTAIQAGGGGPGAPRVTTSIGIALFTPEDTADLLLHRADTALYAAKHNGRNQSRLAA